MLLSDKLWNPGLPMGAGGRSNLAELCLIGSYLLIFLRTDQRPSYCGSRELEMVIRDADCSRLRDDNEDASVVEIGRFSYGQHKK
jgi:hypothetical protein